MSRLAPPRPLGAVLVLVLVALAVAAPAALARTVPGDGPPSPFYELPAPGAVLRSEPLPQALWLPGTGDAHRVLYQSTGWTGAPTTVSGMVFVPAGEPPEGGWPVVAWAHGTLGIGDACAPSATGANQRDTTYLSQWLAEGYAIAATDYEGLGTPGAHPYLHARSEAVTTVDMVRAARALVPGLSDRYAIVGQSQGGQGALTAAVEADELAPELSLVGVIATAPLTRIEQTIPQREGGPDDPASPLVPLILAGIEITHPDVDVRRILTPRGVELLDQAYRDCVPALAAAVAGLDNRDVVTRRPSRTPGLVEAAARTVDPPVAELDAPVFVAQGLADTVVLPKATTRHVRELCRVPGNDVTYRTYEGLEHQEALFAAFEEDSAWLADLFAGRPTTPGCA